MSDPATPENYYHYNLTLKQVGKKLRTEGTKAEACLWKWGFRAGQMRGYGFRRQRPILQYVADLVCKEKLDGLMHNWEEKVQKDEKKQAAIESIGFTVLRFTDEDVLNQINRVLAKIEEYIDEFETGKKDV